MGTEFCRSPSFKIFKFVSDIANAVSMGNWVGLIASGMDANGLPDRDRARRFLLLIREVYIFMRELVPSH
jgi:hypothetical protein